MADEHDIKISQWPKQKALLEHYFKLDEPCPVSVIFDEKPAFVKVGNDKEGPFDVDMNMNLSVTKDIPVCIKICEPICAISDYRIGIEFLGKPLASITVRGKTKLGPCGDPPKPVQHCVDFSKVDPKQNSKPPLTLNGIQFTPLSSESVMSFNTMGEPSGQLKLQIPNVGMRIDFPQAVTNVEMKVVNFGNPAMQINGFNNASLVYTKTEMIQNTTQAVSIANHTLTAIEIKGGSNEAALVDVCYSNAQTTGMDTHRVVVVN